MRWLSLAFVAFFCLGLCCDEHNGPDGKPPDEGAQPSDNAEPAGPPQVVDTQYVRLTPGLERLFAWTSTGPGTITASISWTGSATLTLYIAKGGVWETDSGPSPLEVSGHAAGAGEEWTIGMQNPSATNATVSYTLTFLPD
ncbi:MAG: hypothetical protein JW889_16320 [Verrucomicrobia bacterium]|nr:hypothetical protein [Verrucomicrobiota bacterium]